MYRRDPPATKTALASGWRAIEQSRPMPSRGTSRAKRRVAAFPSLELRQRTRQRRDRASAAGALLPATQLAHGAIQRGTRSFALRDLIYKLFS
jgi:hypothetical protein